MNILNSSELLDFLNGNFLLSGLDYDTEMQFILVDRQIGEILFV
jgi:hypothetical protein